MQFFFDERSWISAASLTAPHSMHMNVAHGKSYDRNVQVRRELLCSSFFSAFIHFARHTFFLALHGSASTRARFKFGKSMAQR